MNQISTSNSDATTSKRQVFDWNNFWIAKQEYHSFYNQLQTTLEAAELSYVLDPVLLAARKPKPPLQTEDEIAAEYAMHPSEFNLYMNKMSMYNKKMIEINTHEQKMGKAIAILKLSFLYDSMPMIQIENRFVANNNNHDRWIACMETIKKSFKPDTGEDVQLLRKQLYGVKDTDRGFSTWVQKFMTTIGKMEELGHRPTDDELDAIVKDSIVHPSLTSLIINPMIIDNKFAWKEAIDKCINAMKLPEIRAQQPDLSLRQRMTEEVATQYAQGSSTADSRKEELTRTVAALITSLTSAVNPKSGNNNLLAKPYGAGKPSKPVSSTDPLSCKKCCRNGHVAKNCVATTCSLCQGAMTPGEWHPCPQRPDVVKPANYKNHVPVTRSVTKRARSGTPPAVAANPASIPEGDAANKKAKAAIRKVVKLIAPEHPGIATFLTGLHR